MKVLVCGGRKYSNQRRVDETLNQLHKEKKITKIIHGGASGADRLGYLWAVQRRIRSIVYHADWKIYGNSAGPIRNKLMFDTEKPNVVVAFPGGAGTEHMVQYAKSKGARVIEVRDET